MRFNDSKILAQKYERLVENTEPRKLSFSDKLHTIQNMIASEYRDPSPTPAKDIITALTHLGFEFFDEEWTHALTIAMDSLIRKGYKLKEELGLTTNDVLEYFYNKEVPASEVDPQSFPSEEAEMDLEDEEVWDDDECNAHHYNETEKFQDHKLEYEVEDAEDMDIISVEPGMEMEIEEVPNDADVDEIVYADAIKAFENSEHIKTYLLSGDGKLEDWMKAKLSKAADYLTDVWDQIKAKQDLNSSCDYDEY